MADTVDPTRRGATSPTGPHSGPVTLINSFVVPAGREEAFQALWTATSLYFRSRPGFVSLRLHRALSPDAHHRFVNVARWAGLAEFQAAHETDEFRRVVAQPGWGELPSSPVLHEVVVEAGADPEPAADGRPAAYA